jgi:hypothetical protein
VAGEFVDGVLRVRRGLGEAGVAWVARRLQLRGGLEGVDGGASTGQGGRRRFAHWPRRSTVVPARVSGVAAVLRWEDEQRSGMGESEAGRLLGVSRGV